MKRFLCGLVALALLIGFGFSAPPAHAKFILTLSQVGSDVVASGRGTIDLTYLSPFGS
jgi:hypothetical protein